MGWLKALLRRWAFRPIYEELDLIRDRAPLHPQQKIGWNAACDQVQSALDRRS